MIHHCHRLRRRIAPRKQDTISIASCSCPLVRSKPGTEHRPCQSQKSPNCQLNTRGSRRRQRSPRPPSPLPPGQPRPPARPPPAQLPPSALSSPAGLRRFRTMQEQLASPLSGVLRGHLLTEAACCDGDWWCQWWCQCKGQVCRPRHRWMTHLIRNEKSSQASRHRGPTTCGVQARSQMTCDISEAPMRAADESCEYRGRLRPPSSDGGTTVSFSVRAGFI